MPSGRIVNTGHGSRILLLQLLDLFRVHVEGCLSLAVVELGTPDLSLRLEGVEEVLCPVHIVARGGLVVLHHSIGGEQVVDEVDRDWGHHGKGQGQLGARGHVATDTGTLVRMEDRLFKSLHGLDRRELTIGDGIQSVHLSLFIIIIKMQSTFMKE